MSRFDRLNWTWFCVGYALVIAWGLSKGDLAPALFEGLMVVLLIAYAPLTIAVIFVITKGNIAYWSGAPGRKGQA
ncbi:hypothetical protein [Arthrobacter sp. CP30]